jgi:hypothetical protein
MNILKICPKKVQHDLIQLQSFLEAKICKNMSKSYAGNVKYCLSGRLWGQI